METLQLSVLDLPIVNELGILTRFKIQGNPNHEEAIAQFAETIGEIRLDQLPDDRAGHWKSDRHIQTVVPIEIAIGPGNKLEICDRKNAENIDDKFLENPNKLDSFPEISTSRNTHGYVEHYFVIGKNKRVYYYLRYVYQDISGKLRHHHISKKQAEAIATLWRTGASAKEICIAIGKKHQ